MNDTVQKLYNDYLAMTGSEVAASNLALADIMQSAKDEVYLRDSRKTVQQVAEIYGVSHVTVRGWIRSGKLAAIVVSPESSTNVSYRVTNEAMQEFDVQVRLPVASQVATVRRRKSSVPSYV